MDDDSRVDAGPLNRSRDDIAAWLQQDAARQAADDPPAAGAALLAAASQGVAGFALKALRGASGRGPQSPAAATWHLAGDTAHALLRPAARSHPWTLVAVAALGGAALVAGRRWRWLLQPILLHGVMAQLSASLPRTPVSPPRRRATRA